MTLQLPGPGPSHDVKALFLDYLDYYRGTVATKVATLDEADLRSSRLPSGWSPIELVKHLAYMERRWLVWGFLGEDVAEPWGDHHDEPESPWQVRHDETLAELLDALRAGGARTRSIVEAADLTTAARPGGRFTAEGPLPSLTGILFHVLQEYARHTGHLDIARELVDGQVGE